MNQRLPLSPNRAALGLLPLLLLFGTGQESPLVSLEGEAQGTTYHIKYRDDRQRNLKPAVDSLLADIDRCLSLYRPDSELSVFNRGREHRFRSEHFYPVLQKAAEVFRETDGAFDPTVMPLVEAYGFGAKNVARTGEVDVDSLRKLVGFGQIEFDMKGIRKPGPAVRLDLNGIAQGYSVDRVARLLEQQGIGQYLVEIGGEIRTKGPKTGTQPWTVGLENPLHPDQLHTALKLTNRAMTTAAHYRNQYTVNGQVFSHIINPKTGMMEAGDLLSVTVFAPDAITADAYDTAFLVMGLTETKRFLARHPELDAYLLYTGPDGQLKSFATKGTSSL
ncbi:FAD:protein FMN transferase [Rudanella lutea]|uniref:FAD:protein FMN transferase n=1 Tax=Rudanella lutea TaxID=451374 RepID=UPI000375D479|nr:FAD:protein FMN transferase [Rudanella lutea]